MWIPAKDDNDNDSYSAELARTLLKEDLRSVSSRLRAEVPGMAPAGSVLLADKYRTKPTRAYMRFGRAVLFPYTAVAGCTEPHFVALNPPPLIMH